MTEPNYAICVPISGMDNPVEGSTPDKCGRCDVDVWVSFATRAFVQDNNATILCVNCGLEQMQEEKAKGLDIEIITSELQKRELQQKLLEHGI